jgi:hypothetical protein
MIDKHDAIKIVGDEVIGSQYGSIRVNGPVGFDEISSTVKALSSDEKFAYSQSYLSSLNAFQDAYVEISDHLQYGFAVTELEGDYTFDLRNILNTDGLDDKQRKEVKSFKRKYFSDTVPQVTRMSAAQVFEELPSLKERFETNFKMDNTIRIVLVSPGAAKALDYEVQGDSSIAFFFKTNSESIPLPHFLLARFMSTVVSSHKLRGLETSIKPFMRFEKALEQMLVQIVLNKDKES